MSWTSFLDSVVTTVGSVSGINKAYRGATVDPDRLMRIPRWPKAIIQDMGGQIDQYSGTIYDRQMAITLVSFRPRDATGTEAAKELGTLSEAVVDALTHTRTANAITLVGDLEEIAESVGQGEVYMKTLLFSYSILDT